MIFREIESDFYSITTIFVGGGSMLLAEVIKEANAKGYKKLYLADRAP